MQPAGEQRSRCADQRPGRAVRYERRSLNNKLGLLSWNYDPSAAPFGGGTIRAHPALVRTPLHTSGGSSGGVDCTGSCSFPFSQAYVTSRGLVGGSIVHCQFWSRDPGFAPPNSIGLSDAVRFVVVP
jgi:hypothetical protein